MESENIRLNQVEPRKLIPYRTNTTKYGNMKISVFSKENKCYKHTLRCLSSFSKCPILEHAAKSGTYNAFSAI